jgi:hypothetical protein
MSRLEGADGRAPLLRDGRGRVFSSSRQIKDYLLCESCEARIQANGEDWVVANAYRGEGMFKIRAALVIDALVGKTKDGTYGYRVSDLQGVDREQLTYYGMSIFWRAAVHRWKIGGRTIRIDFGPYEEPIRRYLLGDSFPENMMLFLRLSTTYFYASALVEPTSGSLDGFHGH